ncbi:ABC transporter permease family protein [Noviherbaspirillum aerium]|uniref:metal ABC transporter permease n=1 Tax=Noviherbaspirillum aerium TaxID=2588497 RepID=UPI00124C290B|nr:metal ABC transporter permease [Noviherbaspirillum aerium]
MEYWFLAPAAALLFGLLALAPLGSQVLARGVVFIDLAVAQAAAAAALGATAWLDHPGLIAVQLAAAMGALSCAGLVAVLARMWPQQREALIGLTYVAGACLAMLAARSDPHGREHLSELLAADVLWAGWTQVATLATCAAAVIFVQRRWPMLLGKDRIFFPCFALVASMAVPTLGLLLVFACLIGPGLWLRAGFSMAQCLVAAMGAAGLGLLASWWIDAPSGACVALALAVWGVFSALLRKRSSKQEAGISEYGPGRPG